MTRCSQCKRNANGSFTFVRHDNGKCLCIYCERKRTGQPLPTEKENPSVVFTSFMDSFRNRARSMTGRKVG